MRRSNTMRRLGPRKKRERGRKVRFSLLPCRPVAPAGPIRGARGLWSRKFHMRRQRGGGRSGLFTTQSQPMRLSKKVGAKKVGALRRRSFPRGVRWRLFLGVVENQRGPSIPGRFRVRWLQVLLFRAFQRQGRQFLARCGPLRFRL